MASLRFGEFIGTHLEYRDLANRKLKRFGVAASLHAVTTEPDPRIETPVSSSVPSTLSPAATTPLALDELIDRARLLAEKSTRSVLGIVGAPGAGKSTLCAALTAALGSLTVVVGMDGFHLANNELERLSRRDRKGAPDTFDVDGYVALLRRLRTQQTDVIYAPLFDRQLEESIGSAVPVMRETRLVITEGNYLLLSDGGWAEVRSCLDEAWYLDVDPPVRTQRLMARRESFGERTDLAQAWVKGVDEANAARVNPSRSRADLHVWLTTRLNQSTAEAPPTAPTLESSDAPREL